MCKLALIFGALLLALLPAGCNGVFGGPGSVRGSGNVVTESRQVSGFNEVVLATVGTLTIEQNGSELLTMAGEDNILPLISTEVAGSRLTIRLKQLGISGGFTNTRPLNYRLSVKELSYIGNTASGNIELEGLDGPDLTTETTGSGGIEAAGLSAGTYTAMCSGSGSISSTGKVKRLDVTSSGSGSYEGADLESETATVQVTGSGSATVRVSDTLDATVSGSGSVRYFGNPEVTESDSGSGEIVRLQAR
jgi:hypothetical protein